MFKDAAADIAKEQTVNEQMVQNRANEIMADAELVAAEKLLRAAEIEARLAEAGKAESSVSITQVSPAAGLVPPACQSAAGRCSLRVIDCSQRRQLLGQHMLMYWLCSA